MHGQGRIRRALWITLVALTFHIAGWGSSAEAVAPPGGGSLSNPYTPALGQTYDVPVPGYQELCQLDFTCANFNVEVTTLKFSVTQAGTYDATFSGVDSNRDLAIYVYRAEMPGSPNISYVDVLDNFGNGGTESVTADLQNTDYYLFLISFGGSDTVQVRVASTAAGGGGGTTLPTNITGNYTLYLSGISDSCAFLESPNAITVTQNGSSVTATDQGGYTYTGTYNSSTGAFSLTETLAVDGGTGTAQIQGTVSADSVITGAIQVAWSDGVESCSGSATFSTAAPTAAAGGSGGGGGGGGGCFLQTLAPQGR